jgi:ElaA protein
MSNQLTWLFKKFDDLNPHELYGVLQLRNEVFVVEQNCVFQDADNKDQPSFHLLGYNDHQLAAYARIVPPGISYDEPSIGRIVTSPAYRNSGCGKALVEKAIECTLQLFPHQPIRIGAQLYLKKFYSEFGFITEGDVYLEDGIEHIIMLRPS